MSNNPYGAPAAPVQDAAEEAEPKQAFLLRCWKGKAPLWQAFWLLTIGGYILLNTLMILLIAFVLRPVGNQDLFFGGIGVAALINLAFAFFSMISIWRCAPNTDIYLAKVLARAVALLVAVFLLLQVVGGYLKGKELMEKARQKQAEAAAPR